ncbi:MAG: tetratricopeptide repeat protein, partial [Thermoplasmata archaeon]|nr:tetratricopeptide repeat protein [Thermoplasmata archaeon]
RKRKKKKRKASVARDAGDGRLGAGDVKPAPGVSGEKTVEHKKKEKPARVVRAGEVVEVPIKKRETSSSSKSRSSKTSPGAAGRKVLKEWGATSKGKPSRRRGEVGLWAKIQGKSGADTHRFSKRVSDPRWESYRGTFITTSIFVSVAMLLEYAIISPYWEDYASTYYLGVMMVFGIYTLTGFVFVFTGRSSVGYGFPYRVAMFSAGTVASIVVGFYPMAWPASSPLVIAGLSMLSLILCGFSAIFMVERAEQMVVWTGGSLMVFLFSLGVLFGGGAPGASGGPSLFLPFMGVLLVAITFGMFLYTKWQHLLMEATTRRGHLMVERQRYSEALDVYERALSSKEGMTDDLPWFSKGVALLKMGNTKEALECLNTALKINPMNEAAWMNKGIALSRMGRHRDAVKSYREAIRLNPEYDVAWNNLGNAYARLGEYESAIRCYDKALAIQPGYRDALINKGYVLVRQGKYEEAIAVANMASSRKRLSDVSPRASLGTPV